MPLMSLVVILRSLMWLEGHFRSFLGHIDLSFLEVISVHFNVIKVMFSLLEVILRPLMSLVVILRSLMWLEVI